MVIELQVLARNLSPDNRQIRGNFLSISQGVYERDSLNVSQLETKLLERQHPQRIIHRQPLEIISGIQQNEPNPITHDFKLIQ